MPGPAAEVREQLLLRRDRLESVIRQGAAGLHFEGLLREVDSALERVSNGTYGLCDACGDPIEADRLEADPLIRLCIDHLTPREARALEQDLDLAARVQKTLLPPALMAEFGWEIAYHYQPLGAVSGDYCDVLHAPGADGLTILLGDISGKGVAASMLMAHLHASMRTLMEFGLPLPQLVERANRVFCESTMASHFATLVAARFLASGAVDVCNAGHCPPLHVHAGAVRSIVATGVPVGLFCSGDYGVQTLALAPGDVLVLYTDGVTEAQDDSGEPYGEERLTRLVASVSGRKPQGIVEACVADVTAFLGGARPTDDLTVMAIRRSAVD